MRKSQRPAGTPLGLTSHVPSEAYEHRTKPVRNRIRATPIKPKSTKPRAHRVGRAKQ